MKKASFFLLFALQIGINACSYIDTGNYYAEPVAGTPPSIWVTTNLDTVMLPGLTDSLEVNYQVEIENGEFYFLESYYLDELVYDSDTTQGSFILKPVLNQEAGVDSLKLYFFFSTNSNSLADIVDLEYNYVYLSYPINFEAGGAK